MTAVLIFIHVIVCLLLCTIILMQSGRGGGLTENFAAAGDMLGTQTSGFLIKGTTIFTVVFLITSLTLAYLSSKSDKSLMADKVAVQTTAGESANEVAETMTDTAEEAVQTVEGAVDEAVAGSQAQ